MKKKTENYMISHKMLQYDIIKKMFQYRKRCFNVVL